MKKCLLLSIAVLLLLPGCLTTGSGDRAATDPGAIPPRLAMPTGKNLQVKPSPGAIYNERSGLDLYGDQRARGVGDIITIKIVETSSGSKTASTQLSRQSDISGGITSLFGFAKWLGDNNRNYTPSATNIGATLTNDFQGSGSTLRNSSVTATLSARVIDQTMDGNLVLRGFREIRVNNESQFIILSGIVRPQDIAADNSILSSNLADARIEYSGTGVISDKQQPGWLARGIDVLWPF